MWYGDTSWWFKGFNGLLVTINSRDSAIRKPGSCRLTGLGLSQHVLVPAAIFDHIYDWSIFIILAHGNCWFEMGWDHLGWFCCLGWLVMPLCLDFVVGSTHRARRSCAWRFSIALASSRLRRGTRMAWRRLLELLETRGSSALKVAKNLARQMWIHMDFSVIYAS